MYWVPFTSDENVTNKPTQLGYLPFDFMKPKFVPHVLLLKIVSIMVRDLFCVDIFKRWTFNFFCNLNNIL